MVQSNAPGEIYQLHILLLQINPPIWRRLHVRSDSSIATLHELLQIAFDWSDFHLHRFVIRGKEYGLSRVGGSTFANRPFIPNYGDRYRHGETISTAFVESAINQVVSKRMVKKQQMRWTERGAHLLLQVRTRVLNEEWRSTLSHWYPEMQETSYAKAA